MKASHASFTFQTSRFALVLAGLCCAPGLAGAQTVSEATEPPAADAATKASTQSGDIVVTGSRITRNGFQAPTPTTVLGAEELQRQAPVRIADVVNQLPQVFSSSTPRSIALLNTGANQGGSFLNLRGLGINRTLVLLNSRRIAPQTTTANVDVNLIPSALVTRVDVVTGGASAAWGSDAVSGVVNFVLDTQYQGLKGGAESGITQYGDGRNWKAELTFGTPFAGGRGHLVASGLISDSEAISNYNSRSWYKGSKLVQNPAWVAGNDQPYFITLDNVGLSTATRGGLITAVGGGAPTGLVGLSFNPDGSTTRMNLGTVYGPFSVGGNAEDLAGENEIQPRDQQQQVFAHASYELTDNLKAFVEASYAKTINSYESGSIPQGTGLTAPALTIRRDNAYLPQAIRDQMPVGSTFTMGRLNFDGFNAQVRNERKITRFVGGLDIRLPGDFKFSGYLQYGQSKVDAAASRSVIANNLALIADAVQVTAENVGTSGLAIGSIVCRSTLANPANGCVPANVFGFGNVSSAALAYATGTARQRLTLEEFVGAGQVSGTPFSTWAGPVSIVVGAEARRDIVKGDADALSMVNAFRVGNFKPIYGRISVAEFFGEVDIPLLKDGPFAKALDLNGAIRRTHYSTSGNVTTWKLGLSWSPVEDLRFRATRSRDIRAPNINELFASPTSTSNSVFDAHPNVNTTVSVPIITRGNLALQPEVSRQLGIGAVYRPSWFPNFGASLDYYDILINNAITTVTPANMVSYCNRGYAEFCSSIDRNANSQITQVRSQPVNGSSETEKGVDIELSYQSSLEALKLPGMLNLRALATHIWDRKISVAGVSSNILGQVGVITGAPPRWRGRLSTTYTTGSSTTSFFVNYSGPGVIDNMYVQGGNQALVSIDRNAIDSFTTVDFSQTFTIQTDPGRIFEIYGAISNLTNAAPPRVVVAQNGSAYTGVSALFDVVGRSYRVGARFRF